MKKLIAIVTMAVLLGTVAYAAEDTITSPASVSVLSIFSIEFFDGGTTGSVRYPNGDIDFNAYDPSGDETMVFTTQYSDGDLKSDVGVVCRTNIGQDWALKIRMQSGSASFLPTNIAVYKPDVVYDRNTTPSTQYSTGATKQWYIMSDSYETIFTGTGGLQNTAPFGILATFSFAILPTGTAKPEGQSTIGSGNILPQGAYNVSVDYTLTTTL